MSDALDRLAATIAARRDDDAGASYTRTLLDGGPQRCAKKFGEEAVETVIAALDEDAAHLTSEAADVLYHLLVLLASRDVPLADVMAELDRRAGVSGHAEKA
ncbi:MAG: phosphoribosyl-ATP diphosphatase, partial [Pseudomonadota bacterium]